MTSIFLSYHRPDAPRVIDDVVAGLRDRGFADLFAFDTRDHGGYPGEPWADALRRRVATCDAMIVLTGPGARTSERCTEEITRALSRTAGIPIVELVVAGDRGRDLLADRLRISFAADPEGAVGRITDELVRLGVGPTDPPAVSSPYPGLDAFDETHARYYFGRARDAAVLVRKLDLSTRNGGALAVVGPSGSGKSSLVRAGLIPRLRTSASHDWVIGAPFTPGTRPITSLATTLAGIRHAVEPSSNWTAEGVEARLRESVDAADGVVSEILDGAQKRVLLVLDQAEELVTMSDEQDVAALARILLWVVSSERAWLVYTLRSDFLNDLLLTRDIAPLIGESHLVRPLDRQDVFDVITRPAMLFGWEFEPRAIVEMVEDMGDAQNLPLLAYVLHEVFREVTAARPYPGMIFRDDYLAVGRVQDVLAERAEIAFRDAVDLVRRRTAVGTRVPDAERTVLRLLRRLVSVREDGTFTRRTVRDDDLTSDDIALLRPFVDARVLSYDNGATDVSHEALLTSWTRLQNDLQDVSEALRVLSEIERRAGDWGRTRSDDLLLSGPLLLECITTLRQGTDIATGDEPGFDGWIRLEEQLRALGLADGDITYLGRSLQSTLLDEIDGAARELDADPGRTLRLLCGVDSDLQKALMQLLLDAPDLRPLIAMVHRAMAAHPVHLVVDCHRGGTWGAAWSPDDRRIVTGGRDQSVRIWSVDPVFEGGALLHSMSHGEDTRSSSPMPGWVRSVAWSGDGRHILSVATDETLRIWDARSGNELRTLNHPDRLWSVDTPKAGGPAVTASADGSARVFTIDRATLEPSEVLRARNRLWGAALSPDSTRVAVACEDQFAYVFTLGSSSEPMMLPEHPHVVRSIAWSPDGTLIGTGCQDGVGRVFDAKTGELRLELRGHSEQIRTIRWSPEGQRIATGSADLDIRIWDSVSGSRVARFRQHTQGVCALDWSSQGDRLVSASDDGTARVWKIGSEPTAVFALDQPATTMAWSPTRRTLAVGVAEGTRSEGGLNIVHIDEGTVVRSAVRHDAPILSIDWSSSGELLTSSADRSAARWHGAGSDRPSVIFTGARDAVVRACWSPDARIVLTAGRDRIVRMFTADGERLPDGEPEIHSSFLTGAAWDGSGRRFAVISDDHQLSVTDLATRAYTTTDVGGGLRSVAWNGVTGQIAVGRANGAILVYRCADGLEPTIEHQMDGHGAPIVDLAWSPHGHLLCVVSDDLCGSVWNGSHGTQLTRLVGHAAGVTGCAWISDVIVATCGADRTVRLWNVADGDEAPMAGLKQDGDSMGSGTSADYARKLITTAARRVVSFGPS